ncbi:MAG: hypothetical protein R3B82_00850 [Sandaracinaceae bacterium]
MVRALLGLTLCAALGCTRVDPDPCDGGCDASAPVDAGADAGTGDAGVDAGPGLDAAAEEPEPSDFADCVSPSVCPRVAPLGVLDLRTDATVTVAGRLDDLAHPRSDGCRDFPDVDVFALMAAERSMVEIRVEPQLGVDSLLRPVALTFDGATALTFATGDWSGPGEVASARTMLIVPSGAAPIHVVLEDARNIVDGRCASGIAAPAGGPGFGYRVVARRSDFAPEELGDLTANASRSAAPIAARGDLTVYRFTTAAPRPSIDVTLVSCVDGRPRDECEPFAVPLDATMGQALWRDVTVDADVEHEHRDWGDAPQSEYLFLVTDLYGNGGPGYAYDLVVTVE